MIRLHRFIVILAVLFSVLLPLPALSQKPAPSSPAPTTSEDVAATHDQLIKLLRLSPKLAAFVSRDPSLLSDQEYVSRNNPQLAAFLQQHPDVARNAEFYVAANLPGRREPGLREEFWPEPYRDPHPMWSEVEPLIVFVIVLAALFWLIRILLETRRWNKTFHVQTEIYNKMLDKFSSNQELLEYIRSEAGHRFLESATLPQISDSRAGAPLSRVLIPTQVGVVLTMLGVGLFSLRRSVDDVSVLVCGVLALAIGIGFIISAALSWALARHFGLWSGVGAHAEGDLTERPRL